VQYSVLRYEILIKDIASCEFEGNNWIILKRMIGKWVVII
jgi:hypothetical protein